MPDVFNCLLDLRFSELYIWGVKSAYVSVELLLVNCLLNAFAICLCLVAILLLKEIVLL